MKIGIYNPYLDSLGGGERYTLAAASHWSKKHTVDIFWDNQDIISLASARFGLDLSRIGVVKNIFASGTYMDKAVLTKKYDMLFVLSDGSIPSVFSKRAIIHFQVPFAKVRFNIVKKYMYQRIVVNSEFTKENLDPSFTIPRIVIYPPVPPILSGSMKKTKTILSVGRFGGLYNAKKHDVLVGAFRALMSDKSAADWRLIIAGSLLESDKEDFVNLQKLAKGISVELHPNCDFSTLESLYETSLIYWHAAGFGEIKPENMEHFGMSTVEAMNAGCVPVSFAGGGQPEIISDRRDGFLWKSTDELKAMTLKLISNPLLLKDASKNAIEKSKQFSVERFEHSIDALLSDIL